MKLTVNKHLDKKGYSLTCREWCLAFFFFQYSLNLFFNFGNTLPVLVTLKEGHAVRLGYLLFSTLPLLILWLWSSHHGCNLFWIFVCIHYYGIYFLYASLYFNIFIYFGAVYLLSFHLRWNWAGFKFIKWLSLVSYLQWEEMDISWPVSIICYAWACLIWLQELMSCSLCLINGPEMIEIY